MVVIIYAEMINGKKIGTRMATNLQELVDFKLHPDSQDGLGTAIYRFGDTWHAEIRFCEVDDQLVVSHLVIEPMEASGLSGGITADLLRKLKLGEAQSDLLRYLRRRPAELLQHRKESISRIEDLEKELGELPAGKERQYADFEHFLVTRNAAKALEDAVELIDALDNVPSNDKKRNEAQKEGDRRYVLVALLRLMLQDEDFEDSLNNEMASRLTGLNGGHRPSDNQVKNWLQAATKRGLLEPGKQGRTQRNPGPNLWPEYHRLYPKNADDMETP